MSIKKSRKKLWIILAAAVIVILIVIVAVIKGKNEEGIKVSTEKVTKRTIIQTVSS